MLLPLPTPQEMATWDRKTIQGIGIPGMALMESASREAVTVLLEEFGPVTDMTIHCFAGSGNNGGDAFAMGRQLFEMGANVTVFHTKQKTQYQGDAHTNLVWADEIGVPLKHLGALEINALPQPDVIIDGLLGTGFQGDLRTDYIDLIDAINRMGEKAFVLSVDIPSGMNGLTGQAQPIAIAADVTVTFQAAKLGLAMPDASQFTGMLHVRPIGIPETVQQENPVGHHLISRDAMQHIPPLDATMHKGSAGHVLIIGGSMGLTGAPHLAALGALRSGAGLVTVACPGGLAAEIKAGSPDIMTLPLGKDDRWSQNLSNIILNEIKRFDAVVIGPGMGRDEKTIDFLGRFIAECPARTVVDADGLYGLAQFPELWPELSEDMVLTPHPGEMARLLDVSNATIQADRLEAARSFVKRCPATLVLKGAGTVVADRETLRISPFSEPNLAIGGSGDVLSGVIASLLARELPAAQAACIGAYWHGLAGRMLTEEFPARGNLASEIAHMLPRAAVTY